MTSPADRITQLQRPQASDDPTLPNPQSHPETLHSKPSSGSSSLNNHGSGRQFNSPRGTQNNNTDRGNQLSGFIINGTVHIGTSSHEGPAWKKEEIKIPNRREGSKSSWPIKRWHAAIIFLVICIAVGVGVGVSLGTKPHSAAAANQATTSTAPTPSTTSSTTSSTPSAQIDQAGCPGTDNQNITANGVTFTVHCYANCNFNANDTGHFKADSLLSCAGNCTKDADCQGAVYVMDLNDPSTCWFKSQTDKRTPDGGRICMVKV